MTNDFTTLTNNIAKNSKLAIWGCCDFGKKIYNELKNTRKDVEIKYFIDKNAKGNFDNTDILTIEDFFNHANEIDCAIIASYSSRYRMEFILKSMGIKKILIPKEELFRKNTLIYDFKTALNTFKFEEDKKLYTMLYNFRKSTVSRCDIAKYYEKQNYEEFKRNVVNTQYLDFINKDEIKVLLEGGGMDCANTLIFLNSFKNCKKAYSFEPCYDEFKDNLLDLIISKNDKIEIVKKALFDKVTTCEFKKASPRHKGGSAFSSAKPEMACEYEVIKVECTTIDEFIKEKGIKKLDFIKLDIENAELNVLEGAKETLINHRPQIATAIYHSDMQFIHIPIFLKEILKNYTFRLQHYTDRNWDTVLFAIPDEIYKN